MTKKQSSWNWDKLYQPERFEQIKILHQRAFSWEEQGYIPLGIHVANPKHVSGISYRDRLEPDVFYKIHTNYLADTLEVGSDVLPTVAMNQLGDVLVPTMFGAQEFIPEELIATLQDLGSTPKPVFQSIQEVEGLSRPEMETGIYPRVEAMCREYRQRLPEWVDIVGPLPIGPFSIAMLLRGSNILIDLLDFPELCEKLIMLCARLQLEAEKKLRTILNPDFQSVRNLTNFGVQSLGLRLGDDSICNLSPELIRQFCRPPYQFINESWSGHGHVHFCSLPHSRFEHLYPTLAEMPEVKVISSQFGFEYYQQHYDHLYGNLAIESFYGDALRYVSEKEGSFKNWAYQFVPKYKNKSGLVFYCQVSSVEEGKQIWETWQDAHEE